ncbi:peptidoglycan DD-metalloendopeptidase family protein [Nitrincola schmidtii]|uniref:peptidoglycan DD-metalloendopeptidase family protein n=1 Tax=Nitrincola schmidtii TaxID=1730894 RepID=UPI00124ED087|nr:peptidoglycan DD-metalloendopeptidase family protein [Nitrincola schmidtii]
MQLRKTDSSALSAKGIPTTHIIALSLAVIVTVTAAFWPDSDTSETQNSVASSRSSSTDNLVNDSASPSNQATTHISPKIRYRSENQTEYEGDTSTVQLTQSLPENDPDTLNNDYAEFDYDNHVAFDDESLAAIEEDTELPEVELELRLTIDEGDTLSTLFDQASVGQTVMYQILSADEQLLALDILRPGNLLTFRKNPETHDLEEMELYVHIGKQVIYRRVDNENFEFEEVIHEGDWEQEIIAGEIYGSFYVSAIRAGLTKAEIHEINKLLSEQIDFNRQIQAGDRFQVVRNAQYVGDEFTGQTSIEAIRLQQSRKSYTAFLFEDGNYYDSNGDSLTRAFRRLPHNQNFRISSQYNPTRRHPVTGRVAPHNGTDFAMPTGTPIVSIGDGVVTRVENHPFAGKYLEIRHNSTYATRYLHMHRIDVRRGDSIKRGQRIGLSGATGRVTGPHLHFELHVNGRPVNPMTANLPLATSVPKEQLAEFNKRVDELVSVMEVAREEQFAMRRNESQPGT